MSNPSAALAVWLLVASAFGQETASQVNSTWQATSLESGLTVAMRWWIPAAIGVLEVPDVNSFTEAAATYPARDLGRGTRDLTMTLSRVPRELAERLFISDCPHAEGLANLKRCRECLEAVIREAMQKALEAAEQVLKRDWCRKEADTSNAHYYRAGLEDALAAIRSLIASSLTEQETTKCVPKS